MEKVSRLEERILNRFDQHKHDLADMDPVAALGVIGNIELTEIATQVRTRMERVLAAL